jgi:DNA polymerase-3 subunit epsilon
MTQLFFDTETTGLVDKHAPITSTRQPYLVQLAAILLDDDGIERAVFKTLIDPEGAWVIPDAATAVHGITTEDCRCFGMPLRPAIQCFFKMLLKADTVVAHNIAFDVQVVEIAYYRVTGNGEGSGALPGTQKFCTMEAASPIMNLPPTERMVAAGFNKPKPPKLSECIEFFFGEKLEGAHDALIDVRACARVYAALKARAAAAEVAA